MNRPRPEPAAPLPQAAPAGADLALNPSLAVGPGNKQGWNRPANRRAAFHDFGATVKYARLFRSRLTLGLGTHEAGWLARRSDVARLTALPVFSAMIVAKGPVLLFERYAPDFGPGRTHSIQSITKTLIGLIIGKLIGDGRLGRLDRVGDHLPEIGSGYRDATIQQVLDMDLVNDYGQDFSDSGSDYYAFEEAMAWRLSDCRPEGRVRDFVRGIESRDIRNRDGHAHYKDTNSAVLAWIAERAAGQPLEELIAAIVDAAGLEGSFGIATDRAATPSFDGGGFLTARDLVRYGLLVFRRGVGVDGNRVGHGPFLESALTGGIALPKAFGAWRYSHHFFTDGRFLAHSGWGGQFLLVDMSSGVVAAYLSVSEHEDGLSLDYADDVWAMLRAIARQA